MAELRDLLELTAGLAADFYDSLPERAGVPGRHRRRAPRGVRATAAGRPDRPRER